jgi:hypothetical protein
MIPNLLLLYVFIFFKQVAAQEGVGITAGIFSESYNCPPTCKPPCYCASTSTPGGLSPSQIPQFMTLTFDDDVNDIIGSVISNLTEGYVNPNGCPLSATFFVSVRYTDFWLIQKLHNLGHEIATHTMSHVGFPSTAEIVGAHQSLSAFSAIPKKMVLELWIIFRLLVLDAHF